MNDARRTEAASDRLVERIRPILAGHAPEAQGAALGQLLALWIAGFCSDSPEAEAEARDGMMEATFDLIRQLVPIMYEQHVKPKR